MFKQMFQQKDDGLFRGDFGASFLDVKAIADSGEFEGYASIFSQIDQGYDIVLPGAFTQTLIDRPVAQVRMLFQHRPDQVIGKWLDMKQDQLGLWVRGRLNLNVQLAKETYALLMDGAIDGLSIGYRVPDDGYEIDRVLGIRRLKSIELFETSIVTFPMQTSSTVTRVKSGATPTKRDVEKMLTRDAGLSSIKAKALLAGGYDAMVAERDAGTGDADRAAIIALNELAAAIRS